LMEWKPKHGFDSSLALTIEWYRGWAERRPATASRAG
jgi:hypothetical protein